MEDESVPVTVSEGTLEEVKARLVDELRTELTPA